MKISELPKWETTIPINTWAIVSMVEESGKYKNYRIDLSKLSVSGGSNDPGSSGGITEERVREIIQEEIGNSMETLGNILADTLSGNIYN